MGFVSGILDRIILVVGVLAGGTIPSFIAQFRQRLGGHLDQALTDLKPFQDIANQLHNGSLDLLVKHHLNSIDPTFKSEGNAIAAMQQSAKMLGEAWRIMQGDIQQQIKFMVMQADPNMLQATWHTFEPAFGFTEEALIFAGVLGVSAWLIFLALSAIVGWIFGRSSRAQESDPDFA